MNKNLVCFLFVVSILSACVSQADKGVDEKHQETSTQEVQKIVSLSGALTETVVSLGKADLLVGVDITSTYPEDLVAKLPKLGHISSINSEGVLALKPDLVLVLKKGLRPELLQQIESAGVEVLVVDQEFSIESTKQLINQISDRLEVPEKGDSLITVIDEHLAEIKPLQQQTKGLFIYARGAGNMSVGGNGSAVAELIEIAGGENVANGFEGYKPLTAESMVSSNPEVILMFQTALSSMGGIEALKQIPAIAQTTAGRENNFIGMDGLFMAGFGPRVGEAALELNKKLVELNNE